MTKRYRASLAVGLSLALLMSVSSAAARDIDEWRWIQMESENFSVYSSVNRRRTEELLVHLELLRAVFVNHLGFGANAEEKPTEILVVGRESDYRDLGLSIDTAGQFRSNLRNNVIIIRGMTDESQVILHEYIHFLVRVTDRFPFPLWWDEGFAEYASATRLTNSEFQMGRPLNGRINALNYYGWLEWEDVIAASAYDDFDRNGKNSFYAQSWLLVHYLQSRPDVHLNQRWAAYAEALNSGADQVEAFTRAFDLSMDSLKEQIEAYARAGRFQYLRVPREVIEIEFEPTVADVPRAEMQVQLGQFTSSNGDYEAAVDWFDKAIERRPEDPAAYSGRARALAGLGFHDEARSAFEQALELDPEHPLTLLDYGIFESRNAYRDESPLSPEEHLDASEALLTKARDITGGSVEIDTYLAYIWLRRDARSNYAMHLLEGVVERSPSDLWPALMLAEGYARNGRTEEALALANSVIRYDHGRTSYSSNARALIGRIEAAASRSGRPSSNSPES